MGYDLGVDLGTTYTAAAVHREGRAEIATLGNRAASIPSVVFLKEDETILAGDAANRRGVTEPDRVAREFKRRVGDPTPMLLGGVPYSAEALLAKLLGWTVEQVTELEGGPPGTVAVTHPANWGAYKQDLLGQAVRLAGLTGVTTLSEPEAAAIYYASNERVASGTVVAVYDLGGGTFDAAVLRKDDEGWSLLGDPEGIERLGGIDFDEAVFAHVRRALPEEFEALDARDPTVRTAVARLRQDCVEAKEALSSDTDVSIPVMLPTLQTEVRLTRAEFEALVRPTLQDTIGALQRSLRAAAVEPDAVDAVLLVGGSSRIPLVAQLVGSEVGRPVAVDAHPKHAIALGASLAAAASAHPEVGLPAADAVEVEAGTEAPRPAEGATVAMPLAHATAGDATAEPEVTRETTFAALATDAEPPGRRPATASPPSGPPPSGPPSGPSHEDPPGPPHDEPPDTVPLARPEDDYPTGQQVAGTGRRVPVGIAAGVAAVALAAGVAGFLLLGGDDAEVAVDEAAAVEPAAEEAEPGDEAAEDDDAEDEEGTEEGVAAEPTREPPYADITDVEVVDGRYVLTYDATGFTPMIDDAGAFHVHFFWDTLPVLNAGSNGPDPGRWLLWDTPFEVSDAFFDRAERPPGSRQICVVIADNAHGVADVTGDGEPDTDTGGCIDIPDD
jgi:molecular chaperone DnaK